MVEAYNYYAGGFIPKVNPKTNVHNRRELKNKYKSIVALNNANPLAMISLSPETSNYALDVKSLSMELGEAVADAMILFHSITACSSPSPKWFMTHMQTTTMTIITRAIALPRWGL